MGKLNAKTIALAAVILVLLAAVIIVAITLDQNNTVHDPADNPSNPPSATHSVPVSDPSGTQGDMIEGSMGLGDNPFNN